MDISQITDYLYVGSQPQDRDYDIFKDMGIGLVINMRFAHPFLRQSFSMPIDSVRLRTFDNPLIPIPVFMLTHGVRVALPKIKAGEKILTHCAAGVHRSVAMASSILIGMGHSADEAMAMVERGRAVADPHAVYIERQIRRFEMCWKTSLT